MICLGTFWVLLGGLSAVLAVVFSCVVLCTDKFQIEIVGSAIALGILFALFIALNRGHVHGDYYSQQMHQWEIEKAITKHYHVPRGGSDD